ncbi:uncharacterized protein LOC123875121 [Maniola jurtina]|uniref:uncharacterized protein LOC123875121 n=1 Tax=Maniola jurtina TaxID=191418 RepID=UPI001E687D8D|nr:uncharacterized protein LOC123875121 [Maniola jurtina]XP_045776736.1 uncharacterized protein LOC123875121 [Maniola jurtina]
MHQYKSVFVLIPCFLLVVCFGEISIESKEKFLNGFVEYLNNLPEQIYTYDEGVLLNAQKTDDGNGCYYIEARLRANDIHNVDSSRYLKCSATIQDLGENGISIQNNQHQCEDDQDTQSSVADGDILEGVAVVEQTTRAVIHQPVHLDNEVQSNTGVTSGEEFVAVPRRQYGGACVGCSSHVNPQAPGVSDLAALGIKHLDRHEPTTKHLLQSVFDVERQVQVVNGVRYTLTLQVGFDNCTSTSSDPCFDSKVCRISILEKTWLKLPDGSKYRAVLSNNCTQEWIFGDEGEYIPNNESNDIDMKTPVYIQDNVDDTPKPIPDYDKIANTGSADEILKAIHNTDIQAQIKTEKSLTEKELKDLEEQVIPHENIFKTPSGGFQTLPKGTEATNVKFHHVSEFQTKQNTDNSFLYKQPEYKQRGDFLNENRKKAIDDLMNFFNSAGFGNIHNFPRVKRSDDSELKVMSADLSFVGGERIKDPNNYKLLATESLRHYLQSNDVNEIYEVVKVKNVSVQVVAGTLTRIVFIIAPKNSRDKEISCSSRIWDRPWLKSKEINTTCDDIIGKSVKKRHVLGGIAEKDPNDPRYKQLALDSLKKFLRESKITQHHQLINLIKVTKQIVSGSITKIDFTISPTNCELDNNMEPTNSDCTLLNSSDVIGCHSEIREQAWLHKKEIKVTCDINDEKERKKRQVLGGEKEQNVNDSRYQLMAEESLKKFLQDTGSTQHHKIIKVKKVVTQVVAGSITKIDFTITPTNCKLSNDMQPTNSDCAVSDPSNIISCHSEVWEQPWLNKKDINVSCDENTHKKRRRSLKGKKGKQDPNLPEFKLLAQESLQKYQKSQINKSSNHEVTKVEKVDKQLVSGVKFTIDFIAKLIIECTKNDQKALECKHSENDTLYCHSTIWKRPWKGRNKIDVNCNRDVSDEDSENYRKKRNVSLGVSGEKNVNKEKYKLLAEQTLEKYQRLSNAKNIHKIIKIHHVSEQVVAGILTKIEYSISPTECLIEDIPISMDDCNILTPKTVLLCQAKIWDRPWMTPNRDITIDCKKQDSKNNGKKNAIHSKNRNKRQVAPIEDYIDEDIKYYYADRAIQHINDKTDTNNIQKLVTIHAIQNVTNMGVNTVRMYIETAFTYCIRHQDDVEISNCEELTGMYHRLCYVRLWPSPDDELVIQSLNVVCDDEPDFKSITGISKLDLIKASLKDIEASPKMKYKVMHQGEPNIIPSLDSRKPFVLSFVIVTTNCSKYIDTEENPFSCSVDTHRIPRSCTSSIWMVPDSKKIKKIKTSCRPDKPYRSKRSISLESTNVTTDEKTIQDFVKESLEKLEMSSLHKYKQRVVQINSFNTKITKGRLTTINFDVGYTTCLKYELVDNITQCEFIEHLPRRHCISQIRERLWLNNGKQIDVNCEDDETPLEATIEFESAENAMQLATEALKHIEAKYPHPRKQKVVRVFSLDKQDIAGLHYRMKMEVGYTDCLALSIKEDCKLVNNVGLNKFCRANVWLRPYEHLPTYRVSCDFQDDSMLEIYHKIQTEHLFSDFLTTYKPDYINDHVEMVKRYEIFQNNVGKIHQLNTQERGTARYAVTRFSDLTYEEFSQKYLGLKPNLRENNQIPIRKADIPQVHLPESFDWRHYNAVTEVKDQGACGSCWAFSVTGNIEGQWKMQSGQLVSLSEQELVDCDKLDQGCNGGLPDNAYRAIEQLGGLEAENDYPYEGENDKCAFNKTLSRVQISGAVNISSNETDMAKWLVKNGPISIGINANAMQFYVGGVSHPWRMLCNPSNLDHGVLIVGYGVKNYPLFHKRLPYWIVKNSWGARWGEQGYYRVYRGDGTCGVNQMASSAVI